MPIVSSMRQRDFPYLFIPRPLVASERKGSKARSILVTGAGGSAGNNICWSLRVSEDGKETDITGIDTDKTNLELNQWIDKAYQVPDAQSPRYLGVLNRIIRHRKVELTVPQPDLEVWRLSRDRNNVTSKLFLPDHRTVETCLDKYETIAKWHSAGLRGKPTLVPREIYLAEKKVRQLEFPCWVRARQGAGGLMSLLARTWKEAFYWFMLNREQNPRTDFIAEDYLPGRDFCFMSIWRGGNLVTSMARERLSWLGHRTFGSGGTSKLNRVVHLEKVNSNAVRSIKAVVERPHGVFCVDLKESKEGVPAPTEINCRFTTNVHYLTLASLRLGRPQLNFPWIATRIGLGEDIPKCEETNAFPQGIWFTKNTDMGFTMVEDDKWRAAMAT